MISLSPDELYQALIVGGHRRITSIFGRSKRQHYVDPENTEWSTEIESCCAEMVVCRALNRYWNGGAWDHQVSASDAGALQVRHTHYATGSLILYPEDTLEDVFVLVVGRAPEFRIVGSLRAKNGMTDEHWRDDARSPSWWVPQRDLRPWGLA